MLDLALPVVVRDRFAVILEHVIQVEREAVARRGDSGVHDIQTQLIENGGGSAKPVTTRAREDQYGRGAAHTARIQSHHRFIRARVAFRQQSGVPGHLFGRVL